MARAANCSHDLATILIAIGHLGGDTANQVLMELERSPEAFGKSFEDVAPPLQFQSKSYQDLLTGRRAS